MQAGSTTVCDIIASTMVTVNHGQRAKFDSSEPGVPAPATGVAQSGVDKRHHDLAQCLAAHLDGAGFLRSPEILPPPMVVAVSGGRDSVVLLHLLAAAAPDYNLSLHVAHLDHALRPESGEDAAFVAALAAALQLPCTVERLAPHALKRESGGPENRARRLRYRFLLRTACNVAGPNRVPILVLGHHADDQLETLLLHLVRGAGIQGLTGMQGESTLTGRDVGYDAGDDNGHDAGEAWAERSVRVLRPLLTIDSDELAHYAAHHGLRWREDSSNRDRTFARNRLRHVVLPELRALNPNAAQAAGRTARLLADEWARLRQLDRDALSRLLVEPVSRDALDGTAVHDRIRLDLAGLNRLDLATRRGVIRLALQHLGMRETALQHIDQIAGDLHAAVSRGPHPVMQGLAWSVLAASADNSTERATLSLHRADVLPVEPDYPLLEPLCTPRAVPVDGLLAFDDGWSLRSRRVRVHDCPGSWADCSPWEGWFDAAVVTAPAVTTVQPGMRMAPLGLQGRRRHLGDMLTDAKIHPTLRPRRPVLIDTDSGAIHWLCGLRTAESSKIGPNTIRVLHLQWVRSATTQGHM